MHSYTNLLTHVVYATKNRRSLIDSALESRLYPYFGGIVRQLSGKLYVVNGVEDHIHMLVELPASVAVAEAVGKIKGSSSHWINESFSDRSEFAWQRGYGAFSVSKSNVPRVARYIERQKSHHKKQSSQDELIELLRRHGVSIDDKFVWT
ncbi:MAG: REP-associated tyrosine transposase [Thermoanaerobaculia bacterium]|jgi:REP element-mobilizing transposase RayT|nr:REP-associated tyrosine transposase [Thermoanaerobaculia bacterium]